MSKTQDFAEIKRPTGVEVNPHLEDKKRGRQKLPNVSANDPNSQSDTACTPIMGTPTPMTSRLPPQIGGSSFRVKKMSVDNASSRLLTHDTHRSLLPKILSITPKNYHSPSGLHLIQINPNDACNKLYDRHVSVVHDKYR